MTLDATLLQGGKPVDADAMLVERAVAGDEKAFELLVIKYQRRIQRLIGRMVRDVDLVEDIAQETFIRAYRALAQFRGDAQFYRNRLSYRKIGESLCTEQETALTQKLL